MRFIDKIKSLFSTASLGYGVRDKIVLVLEQVLVKMGKGSPYAVTLSIGTGAKAKVYFEGTYDEFVMLQEIYLDGCYVTASQSVKTIIDLGANIGLAAVWFYLKYPDAIIHCYEPAERPLVLLKKNLPPSARIFPLAIASNAGTITMNVSERSVESSATFSFPHMQHISVQATTLDEAVARMGGNVDVVKMDIEGAEFDVLASSTSLPQIREIVGEVHPGVAERDTNELRRSVARTHMVTTPESPSKSVAFHAIRKEVV